MLLGHDHEPAAKRLGGFDPDALIREARRRALVRRVRLLVAAVLIVGVAALVYLVGSGGGGVVLAETGTHPFANVSAFAHEGELAFVSRGRLWVLDGRTGTLRAVSPAGQQATGPEFSPNGRWLSYTLAGSQLGAAWVWVAGADGSSPRRVGVAAGIAEDWLPNGELLSGQERWRIGGRGIAERVGPAPAGLTAWSSQGGRYVFLRWARLFTQQGVVAVSVAVSLTGRRTTWLRVHPPSKPTGGMGGRLFIDDALVLPGRGGIVLRTQDYCCDWADGFDVDELRAPGAKLVVLGTNVDDVVSVAHDGEFAFTDGLNRYAWMTKRAVRCPPVSERCVPLPTPAGMISLDPTLSPDGSVTAFIEAAGGYAGKIGQASVQSWYATHTLWLLRAGHAAPSEVPGSRGASTPVWSANGRSLLYVAGDALWLLPSTSSKPIRIIAPLFNPTNWNSFYGEVDWTSQFAWSRS